MHYQDVFRWTHLFEGGGREDGIDVRGGRAKLILHMSAFSTFHLTSSELIEIGHFRGRESKLKTKRSCILKATWNLPKLPYLTTQLPYTRSNLSCCQHLTWMRLFIWCYTTTFTNLWACDNSKHSSPGMTGHRLIPQELARALFHPRF